MARLEITLPWPPSVNHYWRHVGARTLISKAGRQYREDVGAAVLEARASGWDVPVLGRLAVTILVRPPDKRRRDLDNLLKAPLDALEAAGVYDDDSQIDSLEIRRGEVGVCGGWLVVVVTGVGDGDS